MSVGWCFYLFVTIKAVRTTRVLWVSCRNGRQFYDLPGSILLSKIGFDGVQFIENIRKISRVQIVGVMCSISLENWFNNCVAKILSNDWRRLFNTDTVILCTDIFHIFPVLLCLVSCPEGDLGISLEFTGRFVAGEAVAQDRTTLFARPILIILRWPFEKYECKWNENGTSME